jgi:hypothetical protein
VEVGSDDLEPVGSAGLAGVHPARV